MDPADLAFLDQQEAAAKARAHLLSVYLYSLIEFGFTRDESLDLVHSLDYFMSPTEEH